jgi:polar amino acid transport system substrate-binding protein
MAAYTWRRYLGLFSSLLLLCATSGFASPAHASKVTDYCSRPIRVGLFEFGILYKAASNDGVDVRLLDAIHKLTGCEFLKVVLPRNRIWAELQTGSLDLATAAIPNAERKSYGYLLPYMKSRNVALVRKGAGTHIKTASDLVNSKVRVGVVRGFKHEPYYDSLIAELDKQARVVQAVDVAENFRLFDENHVDVIFSQTIIYRQYLSEDYLAQKMYLGDWAPKSENAVGALILSRTSFSAEQSRRWDALLVKLQKDGTLYNIYRRFLSHEQAADLVYAGPRFPD